MLGIAVTLEKILSDSSADTHNGTITDRKILISHLEHNIWKLTSFMAQYDVINDLLSLFLTAWQKQFKK